MQYGADPALRLPTRLDFPQPRFQGPLSTVTLSLREGNGSEVGFLPLKFTKNVVSEFLKARFTVHTTFAVLSVL